MKRSGASGTHVRLMLGPPPMPVYRMMLLVHRLVSERHMPYSDWTLSKAADSCCARRSPETVDCGAADCSTELFFDSGLPLSS